MIPESLDNSRGQPVQGFRRIHYVLGGRPDTDFGPFELTIGDRTFLFDNASDGDSLRFTEGAWTDPFAEPMSEENRTFVESSGKWTAFDVSTVRPWASLIGAVLSDVEFIGDETGRATGVVLQTVGGGAIRLSVMADELFIDGIVTPD